MRIKINESIIELVKADITELQTDAIVNAANAQLQMGGGVAGAILSKGGQTIQDQCDEIGPTYVGAAVITGAGKLKAGHVIHAAGPRKGEGKEDTKLKNAILNSLKLADEKGLKSIAFPAISTGIFGFPIERCAEIMLANTIEYLQGETGIEKVVFCLYSNRDFDIFTKQLEKETT